MTAEIVISDRARGNEELIEAYRALERENLSQGAIIGRFREVLESAQILRPVLLKQCGAVPEEVLDYCNRARAALKVSP